MCLFIACPRSFTSSVGSSTTEAKQQDGVDFGDDWGQSMEQHLASLVTLIVMCCCAKPLVVWHTLSEYIWLAVACQGYSMPHCCLQLSCTSVLLFDMHTQILGL